MSHKIKNPDLPKKPLVEAIFEVRWNLQKNKEGLLRDPGLSIVLGRYYDIAKQCGLTKSIELSTAELPEDLVPHVVQHQFRAGDNSLV